ncbi:hypothetical protein D6774_00510 [Candidatus Woesearchaeota archaeon]|nr:MAG: hypothetical protein D6774_00510 [Candidatus Woesearchaeota archaeon]
MNKHITAILFILLIPLALAHTETGIDAQKIISAQTPCSELNDEQLEAIGDYYMEQMHPGEQHELMDEMMGGEGSPQLHDMHVRLAQRFYCDETTRKNSDTQNRMSSSMMMGAGGMNMGYGMMGGYSMMGSLGWGLYSLVYLALAAFIFSVIFWGTKKWLLGGKK